MNNKFLPLPRVLCGKHDTLIGPCACGAWHDVKCATIFIERIAAEHSEMLSRLIEIEEVTFVDGEICWSGSGEPLSPRC